MDFERLGYTQNSSCIFLMRSLQSLKRIERKQASHTPVSDVMGPEGMVEAMVEKMVRLAYRVKKLLLLAQTHLP